MIDWPTDLSVLGNESDSLEFKSGAIRQSELKSELEKNASAFWNTGGGVMIGIKDDGSVDGIDPQIGRQPVEQWVEKVVSSVRPIGKCDTKTWFNKENPAVPNGKIVLGVMFHESHAFPHQAPDDRYYIRAGSHSFPANHVIVESLFARRVAHFPVVKCLASLSADTSNIHQLTFNIKSVNDYPAFDVKAKVTILRIEKGYPDQPKTAFADMVDRTSPLMIEMSVPSDFRMRIDWEWLDLVGTRQTDSREVDFSTCPRGVNSELARIARAIERRQ